MHERRTVDWSGACIAHATADTSPPTGSSAGWTRGRRRDRGAPSHLVADAERRPLFDGVDIFATLQLAKTDFAYAVAEQITTVDVRTMNCEYGAGQLEITFEPKRGLAAPWGVATCAAQLSPFPRATVRLSGMVHNMGAD